MSWKDQIANFIGAGALVASAIGVYLVHVQLVEQNELTRWGNYNAMNLRYYDWYSQMPSGMELDDCAPFSTRDQKIKDWVRTYFDLYSEEYWLYENNLIPKEMLEKRIDGGVNTNLITYPTLVRGYEYWKAQGAFSHPPTFVGYVDSKLTRLRPRLRLKDCAPKAIRSSG